MLHGEIEFVLNDCGEGADPGCQFVLDGVEVEIASEHDVDSGVSADEVLLHCQDNCQRLPLVLNNDISCSNFPLICSRRCIG